MRLIALPWKYNVRYHYSKKLYCAWIGSGTDILGRCYYNWNTADSSTFLASNYMADLSIYWGGREQYTTSEEKAKQLVDIELVKYGWKLLNEGDKLLLLI